MVVRSSSRREVVVSSSSRWEVVVVSSSSRWEVVVVSSSSRWEVGVKRDSRVYSYLIESLNSIPPSPRFRIASDAA